MMGQPASNRVRIGIKRVAARLGLVLAGVSIALLMAELIMRITGVSYPNFYMPDLDRGASLRPGAEGWWRQEGKSYVRINSDGLRDREHSKIKPDSTLRIAVLGDSFTEALQVPMEQTYWAIAEDKLKGCKTFAGRQIEVINFGVGGYGTAQELITLRRRVWDYSPDIVMLAIYTGNDISDNSRSLRMEESVPYFTYRDRSLVLDDSFRYSSRFRMSQSSYGKAWSWIRDSSRVLQVVNMAHYAIRNMTKPRSVDPERFFQEPADPVWNNAWLVTEGLIALMRDEVRARGAKFLVVTLSNGIQVSPDQEARHNLMQRLGVNDLFYPDKRIKAFCEREHIPVIMLAPALEAYADQNRAYLHGFGDQTGKGHWNPLGHRIAGEIIAQRICETPP
jgi:hypothetical protein